MPRPPRYVVLYKPRGITPLECIEIWKDSHPQWKDLPATYAGRLDPMADGKLLVLLGEECKKKDLYTGLDKEYHIQIAFDLSTDTGDTLGIPRIVATETSPTRTSIGRALRRMLGTHAVPYPAYSSKTVDGIALFTYALAGTLDSIEIPTHEETVYKIRIGKHEVLAKDVLAERIRTSLELVPTSTKPSKALGADFRQEVIRAGWRALFDSLPPRTFSVLTLKVTCASGTYMRTLAERIAAELGTTACALSITRTKIGTYRTLGPFGFWTRSY